MSSCVGRLVVVSIAYGVVFVGAEMQQSGLGLHVLHGTRSILGLA